MTDDRAGGFHTLPFAGDRHSITLRLEKWSGHWGKPESTLWHKGSCLHYHITLKKIDANTRHYENYVCRTGNLQPGDADQKGIHQNVSHACV